MSDMQTMLWHRLDKLETKFETEMRALSQNVAEIRESQAARSATIDGIASQVSLVADALNAKQSATQVNVAAIGHRADNSQSITAGGNVTASRDQATASTSSNSFDFSVNGVIEKAKEKPLAAGGIVGGLIYAWTQYGDKIMKAFQG